MIALAVKAKRRRARWEAAATSTSGEVTDLRWQSVGQAGDTNLLAFPILRFSLPDGRTVETQSSWGTNPPAAKPGAQVTVLYYEPRRHPPAHRSPAGGSSAVVSVVIVGLWRDPGRGRARRRRLPRGRAATSEPVHRPASSPRHSSVPLLVFAGGSGS